jgi:hypothetical protein
MDGMGREKIPQISYRRAGDVSNFAIANFGDSELWRTLGYSLPTQSKISQYSLISRGDIAIFAALFGLDVDSGVAKQNKQSRAITFDEINCYCFLLITSVKRPVAINTSDLFL